MDGLVFVLLLLLVFLILMVSLILSLKGRWAVYLTAVTATFAAWFVRLVLDANIDFGEEGFWLFGYYSQYWLWDFAF